MKFAAIFFSILLFLSSNQALAGVCYGAYLESQKLQELVKDVYLVTETDDNWTGFASWSKVTEINEEQIREVLRLGDVYDGEPSYFMMDGAEKAYEFLETQASYFGPDIYDEPEAQKQLLALIEVLKEQYGDNIRYAEFGRGDDIVFIGEQMILIVEDSGCVLGLKAFSVWT